MFHIGYLNLASHQTVVDICASDTQLQHQISPVMAGSTRRIARGILKGWLDGGLLPLPFAHVLARWQKGLNALVCIKGTGSALLTPGPEPVTDMHHLAGKRILFSCIGSMEYLLAHRLFKECGMDLTLEPNGDGPGKLHAEPMVADLIPDALRLNPTGDVGAALVEEPALSALLEEGAATELIHCHDLWPEYTGAVLVMRQNETPEAKERLSALAGSLVTLSHRHGMVAPKIHLPSKADFLATGDYLDCQQLAPLIASLL